MLEKERRLSKQKEVERVFKEGRGSYNDQLGIKVVKNGMEKNRAVIIVGSKVSKKAVVRNRIKRRLSHILRECFAEGKAGYDIAVVVLPSAKERSYKELRTVVRRHLQKLGIIWP